MSSNVKKKWYFLVIGTTRGREEFGAGDGEREREILQYVNQ